MKTLRIKQKPVEEDGITAIVEENQIGGKRNNVADAIRWVWRTKNKTFCVEITARCYFAGTTERKRSQVTQRFR